MNSFIPEQSFETSITYIIEKRYGNKIKVIFCKSIQTPLIFGLLKPVIALPMLNLSQDEWDYILQHEVSHLEHKDLWLKLILDVMRMVYWWNPLVYLLYKHIYRIMEFRADQNVIYELSNEKRVEYADCLLKVAKHRHQERLEVPSLFFDSVQKSTIFQRFQLILSEQTVDKEKVFGKKIFCGLIIVVICLSLFMVLEAYTVDKEVEESTFAITPANSFLVISSEEGMFDLYVDDTYRLTLELEDDLFEDLTVYKSKEEAMP